VSLAIVHSRGQRGIDAPPVTVEVHLANGLPSLSIVGLAETAVKEAKDRVRSALLNARFEFPARRITVNLAPADLPKEGGRFDLPIAIGILAASGQLGARDLEGYELVGELALTGALRPVRSALTVALGTRATHRVLVAPAQNLDEAGLVHGVEVRGAEHLLQVSAFLVGQFDLPCASRRRPVRTRGEEPDLRDVHGQHQGKRALSIAAAGGHSLLFIGPPGTGKTMLARRLSGLLPPLGEDEAVQTAAVQSLVRGGVDLTDWDRRPFRAPHHTASAAALVGGGSQPRPGEVSLAHNGVLFLDELPEFDRRVLEVLREPLESGVITVSRAARQVDFPARFQLVAAMNPCPCGYLGDPRGRCRCTAEQVRRYRARLSGPLLDRIDMHVEMPAVPREVLRGAASVEEADSAGVRERVAAAHTRQHERAGCLNSLLHGGALAQSCHLDAASSRLLDAACERLGLSARGYHRVLRLARTIADFDGADAITPEHIGEAVGYRILDRTSAH